jgi:hypothetical protein
VDGWLADAVAGSVARLRGLDLNKPPGVAEAISWATALQVLGVQRLDVAAASRTLGAVLKYSEDAELARQHGLDELLSG